MQMIIKAMMNGGMMFDPQRQGHTSWGWFIDWKCGLSALFNSAGSSLDKSS
jgi:hypothetical protein